MGIDYWSLARDFAVGDSVQKFMTGRPGDLAPFYGRVTAVLPKIGFVDVQWPFGNSRETPEDLVKVNPQIQSYVPPQINFSYYPGWDTRQATQAQKALWRTVGVPPTFHCELARLWYRGANEVQAYDELWHRFASHTDDESLRDEVARFYLYGSRLSELFWDSVAEKTAAYWSAPGRQYRATNPEILAKRPNCPKCKAAMRKTTYKMAEGQRIRLFACPSCLRLIKPADILGPDGSPVTW